MFSGFAVQKQQPQFHQVFRWLSHRYDHQVSCKTRMEYTEIGCYLCSSIIMVINFFYKGNTIQMLPLCHRAIFVQSYRLPKCLAMDQCYQITTLKLCMPGKMPFSLTIFVAYTSSVAIHMYSVNSNHMTVNLGDSVITVSSQCGIVKFIGHVDGFSASCIFLGLQLPERSK